MRVAASGGSAWRLFIEVVGDVAIVYFTNPGKAARVRCAYCKSMKLVIVEWLGSHAGAGWQKIQTIEGATEPLYCRSVGWLVSENKGCKMIVAHLAGEHTAERPRQGCGDLAIPDKAIVKLAVIGKP